MITVKLLCNQHLIGEHGEIHKHRHNFVKGHKIEGRRGQIEPLKMKDRHDELAIEMGRRGMKHKSPYDMPDLTKYGDLTDFVVNVEESYIDLTNRCEKCRMLRK